MTDLIEHADTEPADGADRATEGARAGPVAPRDAASPAPCAGRRPSIVAICVVVVTGAGRERWGWPPRRGRARSKPRQLAHLDRFGGLAQVHAQSSRGGDRRLPLQLGQPSHHEELVRRFEPVPPRKSRGPPRRARPGAPGRDGPGHRGQRRHWRKGWTCFGAPFSPTIARRLLEHSLPERVGAGTRRRRAPQGHGNRAGQGEPGDRTGALQPPGGRQARDEFTRAPHGAGVHFPAADAVPIPGGPAEHPVPGRRDGAALQLSGVAQLPGPAFWLRRRRDGERHRRDMW